MSCPIGNDEKNNTIGNYCTDAGGISDFSNSNLVVPDKLDVDATYTYNYAPVTSWLQSLGGTGNQGISIPNKQVPFINPEYSGATNSLTTDDGNNGYACNFNDICNNNACNQSQLTYIVTSAKKQANYGDPLMCCLRDFQCNEGSNNDIHGASCFSDNSGTNTCPQSFRATDTVPCQFLTTQYCLGNIGDSLDPTSGLDFTALWVDTTSEIGSSDTRAVSGEFKIYALPQGYAYKSEDNWTGAYSNSDVVYPQLSSDIPAPVLGICKLDKNTGLPASKSTTNLLSLSLIHI